MVGSTEVKGRGEGEERGRVPRPSSNCMLGSVGCVGVHCTALKAKGFCGWCAQYKGHRGEGGREGARRKVNERKVRAGFCG